MTNSVKQITPVLYSSFKSYISVANAQTTTQMSKKTLVITPSLIFLKEWCVSWMICPQTLIPFSTQKNAYTVRKTGRPLCTPSLTLLLKSALNSVLFCSCIVSNCAQMQDLILSWHGNLKKQIFNDIHRAVANFLSNRKKPFYLNYTVYSDTSGNLQYNIKTFSIFFS